MEETQGARRVLPSLLWGDFRATIFAQADVFFRLIALVPGGSRTVSKLAWTEDLSGEAYGSSS
jgi:hypothetical protein